MTFLILTLTVLIGFVLFNTNYLKNVFFGVMDIGFDIYDKVKARFQNA
jgi:Trk-type K+ transport system membrane component